MINDYGYERAQSDYDAQMPPESRSPCCKGCGDEEHSYKGYCALCYHEIALNDEDSVREFAEADNRVCRTWWNDLNQTERDNFIKAAFFATVHTAKERLPLYKDHARENLPEFMDFVKWGCL